LCAGLCDACAANACELPHRSHPTPAWRGGRAWAERVLAGGSGEDAHALAAAVALSRRARHPVSGALAELGAALGRQLPDVAVSDFRLVAGARPLG